MKVQVRPSSGDERTTSVGENKGQVQDAMPVGMAVNPKNLPLQWMVITNDGDFRGKTLEVGSMSYVPSTPSTTDG